MQSIAPFPLSVCGIEELHGHCETGVSHVLSILDPEHPEPEAFGRFGEHAKLELRFDDIIEPTAGKIAPDAGHAESILGFGRSIAGRGGRRGCWCIAMPASRAPPPAMALILAQARPEVPAERLLQAILGIREKAWPNLRLLELGDAMLGRGGSLPAAAAAIYCHQLRIRPHLAEVMRRAGRGREVDAAATAVMPGG